MSAVFGPPSVDDYVANFIFVISFRLIILLFYVCSVRHKIILSK